MKIRTFRDNGSAETLAELRILLKARYQIHYGSFWLYHPDGPEMGLMVNDEEAYVHYFPGDGSAGYRPIGTTPDDWEDTVEFLADNYEVTPIPRAMVVPLQKAMAVIEEFFAASALPKTLQWERL
jgi:hypothetical protein